MSELNISKLKIGGMATLNGIVFQSKNFWVYSSVNRSGENIIKHGKAITLFKNYPRINNLPVIRSLVSLANALINAFYRTTISSDKHNKLLIPILILSIFFISIISPGYDYSYIYLLFQLLFFVIFLSIVRKTRISKFHGAEHKAIAAFEDSISIDHLSIKKAPRLHKRCGSNIAIPALLTLLLSYFYNWGIIIQFILISMILEIFRYVINNPLKLFSRLYLAGGFLFQKITTSEPTDAEIKIAENGIKKLIGLENKQP